MPKHFAPPPTFTIDDWEVDEISEATAAAGVTVDGVLLKDGGIVLADAAAIEVDTISEATAAAGVTIDGVLLKDNIVTVGTAGSVKTDTIAEKTAAAGVTIDGVLLKDNVVTVGTAGSVVTDTISEKTAATGVTIDGALLKDGRSNLGRQVQELTASGAITIKSGIVLLNHATVAIEATLAAPVAGDELFIIDSSASGTAAHTVTVEGGVTWNGTNTVATLNAPGEALHVVATSATRWFIMENINSVGLS